MPPTAMADNTSEKYVIRWTNASYAFGFFGCALNIVSKDYSLKQSKFITFYPSGQPTTRDRTVARRLRLVNNFTLQIFQNFFAKKNAAQGKDGEKGTWLGRCEPADTQEQEGEPYGVNNFGQCIGQKPDMPRHCPRKEQAPTVAAVGHPEIVEPLAAHHPAERAAEPVADAVKPRP